MRFIYNCYANNKADVNAALPYSYTCLLQHLLRFGFNPLPQGLAGFFSPEKNKCNLAAAVFRVGLIFNQEETYEYNYGSD